MFQILPAQTFAMSMAMILRLIQAEFMLSEILKATAGRDNGRSRNWTSAAILFLLLVQAESRVIFRRAAVPSRKTFLLIQPDFTLPAMILPPEIGNGALIKEARQTVLQSGRERQILLQALITRMRLSWTLPGSYMPEAWIFRWEMGSGVLKAEGPRRLLRPPRLRRKARVPSATRARF
ncbi:MAG: hypothetical protein UX48_C0028G0015 [Candidatus Azambacteria bacterium GW2011_GWB1_46_27]|uniref:Uncharacterized protein n=1 Tax=Candidatus Azambacteria bacterium GW2011_GWB1_46_27 TaxID=1618617 RepID=A0A0G1PPH7_9BACT|nr:MAG: hypothetical protein UX48_C0028G0015 [Candidatus Azambacteria bacterium GW2011_GWB1_46_27]